MSVIISTNPSAWYARIGSLESSSESEIKHLVQRAKDAQKNWAALPLCKRVSLLRSVYDACLSQKEALAKSVAREMGMPIKLARDEVQYGLNYFLWYLDNAEKYLSPETTFENETEIHTVFYEPKWVIAAITPWNYPFMLFVWACIQPLLSGNAVVWKISKEVILTGKLIADIFEASPLPKWVWSETYGDGSVGDCLTDGDIDGITFTGSTHVGQWLAKKAFEKNIPALMELGWSAPGIVCEDADIDSIVETIYFMRFSNSGQMCDWLKRLIVHASRYDELLEKLSERLLSKQLGNALDESVDIGPVVSEHQLHALEVQYADAIEKWAIVQAELSIPTGIDGAYYAPKILTHITTDMKVWKEEVFGPILPIVYFHTIDEAIEMANDTVYWLGAYVFTEDRDTFSCIARQIQSGMVQMNNVNYCIPSDPFGWYKSSGIGREHGKWWFYEFTHTKVISNPK